MESIDALPPVVVHQVRGRLVATADVHDVKILHAIESGSRAWGFPSPDSDYDVRFIYAHRAEWYSTVFPQRDVIETPIEQIEDTVFDVNGWDLRKALQLLARSNPVLIEWLQSPILYSGAARFAEEMLTLARQFYSERAAHYHYFHMARKNFREHLGGESIRLKKYFYVLRPVLACRWIEQGMGIPPMQLTELLDGVVPGGALKDEVLQLREQKMRVPEFGEGPPRPLIHVFLAGELQRLAAIDPPTKREEDYAALDAFLRRWAVPVTAASKN